MVIRKTVGAAVVGLALLATVAVPSAGATCTSPKSGKIGCTQQVYGTPPPPPPQPQQGHTKPVVQTQQGHVKPVVQTQQGHVKPPAWVLTFRNQWGGR